MTLNSVPFFEGTKYHVNDFLSGLFTSKLPLLNRHYLIAKSRFNQAQKRVVNSTTDIEEAYYNRKSSFYLELIKRIGFVVDEKRREKGLSLKQRLPPFNQRDPYAPNPWTAMQYNTIMSVPYVYRKHKVIQV